MTFAAASFSTASFSPSAFLFDGVTPTKPVADAAPGARRRYRAQIEANAKERELRRQRVSAYKQGLHLHLKNAVKPVELEAIPTSALKPEPLAENVIEIPLVIEAAETRQLLPEIDRLEQGRAFIKNHSEARHRADEETVVLCMALLI